jgi:hypothetical protein
MVNCGGKVPVKKLVCLLPARRNVITISFSIVCLLFGIITCVYLTYQC